MQLWFSRVLRDGFATAAADSRSFASFAAIAEHHLYSALGCALSGAHVAAAAAAIAVPDMMIVPGHVPSPAWLVLGGQRSTAEVASGCMSHTWLASISRGWWRPAPPKQRPSAWPLQTSNYRHHQVTHAGIQWIKDWSTPCSAQRHWTETGLRACTPAPCACEHRGDCAADPDLNPGFVRRQVDPALKQYPDDTSVQHVMAGIAEAEPFIDVQPAIAALHAAGIKACPVVMIRPTCGRLTHHPSS